MQLGPLGIWSVQFRTADRALAVDTIAEVDELGFGTLWVPESGTTQILDVVADLLAGSSRVVVASGILNIWMHEASDVAPVVHGFHADYPDRFVLGLGVSHASLVEPATGRHYERPRSMMVEFLDALDAAEAPVPVADRVLAALGPKMLELAGERSAGAHPYCVPVEHTALARATLGEGPLLAPELKAVLIKDPETARAVARHHLEHYLEMPNYSNNLRRLGFSEEDFDDGGSDLLVDSLVVWGSAEDVAKRIREHQSAGADHVCVNVLTADAGRFPIVEWREIAATVA